VLVRGPTGAEPGGVAHPRIRGIPVVFEAAITCLAMMLSCGGADPAARYTAYDTCYPPCLQIPLSACLGPVTACGLRGDGDCWDTGASSKAPRDSNGQTLIGQLNFYSPAGELCLHLESNSSDDSVTVWDASGRIVIQSHLDLTAPNAHVWTCDGKTYAFRLSGLPVCEVFQCRTNPPYHCQ